VSESLNWSDPISNSLLAKRTEAKKFDFRGKKLDFWSNFSHSTRESYGADFEPACSYFGCVSSLAIPDRRVLLAMSDGKLSHLL